MKIKVKAVPHKKEKIKINTPFIRLDAFLKFKGLAQTGGHAKELILQKKVRVNGKTCTTRGKKIHPGDTIAFDGTDYLIIYEDSFHTD